MSKLDFENMPIRPLISFHKLLEHYDEMAKSDNEYLVAKAKHILKAQAPYPILREGFTDIALLDKHEDVIKIILGDVISELLGQNEIKAASLPYENLVFNPSKRFQKILNDAGPDFEPIIRKQSEDINYIMSAVVVLNFHYGYDIDFHRPYFYDIPNENGVIHHYRVLYNADFMELIPTDKALELTSDDIDQLLENHDNIVLWKEKIPPGSFIAKGLVICNIFDVTAEHSISEMKSGLIIKHRGKGFDFTKNVVEIFKSFFKINDITTGFIKYDDKSKSFQSINDLGMNSFLLKSKDVAACDRVLCPASYQAILKDHSYFSISDVDKYYQLSGGVAPYINLKEEGVKSAIFAPIADNGKLLGVLELYSSRKNQLNSVVALKLDDIMPFIVAAVLRSQAEEENHIDAIIQQECTSVHPAVHWRFVDEARRFITEEFDGMQPTFNEIVFKDVYPLYGQIDIKDSSKARNEAIQKDLIIQLSEIRTILSQALAVHKLSVYEELIFRIDTHIGDIKEMLRTNSEQAIFNFVTNEIVPVFAYLKKHDGDLNEAINTYELKIDKTTDSYYDHRKNYDLSVTAINKKLAKVIDSRQEEAQTMFPHYFERFKTDGVEHNMYIGDSIVRGDLFDPIYINNLRLWQLQVMCEMENVHYKIKNDLLMPLNVASLILVYNTSLSIRFRLDEKRFDVDGTYNARYEIIKKRIDKSYVKGTNERLTQPGKMVVVYSQKSDELEYLRYIKFLKSKGFFTGKVEIVSLEGLQGVSGLKAIRADISYKKKDDSDKTFTYNDLMTELEK